MIWKFTLGKVAWFLVGDAFALLVAQVTFTSVFANIVSILQFGTAACTLVVAVLALRKAQYIGKQVDGINEALRDDAAAKQVALSASEKTGAFDAGQLAQLTKPPTPPEVQ